ncbi:MAG: ArsR/SmtB family transcription factor [Thermodesulfovibrionales bacterium]
MKDITTTLKLLSDPTRLRILMVLSRKELCVCQIMGVLEVSQSLISKNLHLLYTGGFLNERKDGKLVYYSLKKDMPAAQAQLTDLLTSLLKRDTMFSSDLQSLKDCEAFQKKAGRCDMKTFKEFMDRKRKTTMKNKERS